MSRWFWRTSRRQRSNRLPMSRTSASTWFRSLGGSRLETSANESDARRSNRVESSRTASRRSSLALANP